MAIFSSLSEKLSNSIKKISGKASLSDKNIQDTLRDVRIALLEADVALPVVKQFLNDVKDRALGVEVASSLNPGQQFLKIVKSELEVLMGEKNEGVDLVGKPPAVIMMAGLQGAGKTTTAAKLAKYIKSDKGKRVMLTSADVYRPAAIEQLKILSSEVDVEFFESSPSQKPKDIVTAAIASAKKKFIDVLIIDTAGRLHIDNEMMGELKQLAALTNPAELLFVIDAMIGQDAVNTAKVFNDSLPLSGIILTKVDGDTRGGAALSVRQVTGKPIKFLGVGEKTDALEPFHPDRLASRILGMGDMLSLIEEVESKVDKEKTDKLAKKVIKGKRFDLDDLRDQLQQMKNMGGMSNMLDKLPGIGNMAQVAETAQVNQQFDKMQFILDSMTPHERRYPDILNGSRKRRITSGSGTTIQDLNRLMKQHKQMSKMMKKMKGKGMQNMMRSMSGMMNQGASGIGKGFPRF